MLGCIWEKLSPQKILSAIKQHSLKTYFVERDNFQSKVNNNKWYIVSDTGTLFIQ